MFNFVKIFSKYPFDLGIILLYLNPFVRFRPAALNEFTEFQNENLREKEAHFRKII